MARGGLNYVKRDMSKELEPRTFEGERASVFSPWLSWAAAAFSDPKAELPPLPPPPVAPNKIKAAARCSFLDMLHRVGEVPVERHMQVIQALAPALGWPWEGIDGGRHAVAPANSWLLAGQAAGTAPGFRSGWIEWASASVNLMRDQDVARTYLPMATIVEAWDPQSKGAWCYDAIELWWRSSSRFTPKSHEMAASRRLAGLVFAIDDRLHGLPSPLGLPLHWQVSARQAERCLLWNDHERLYSMDPLPPVHTSVRVGGAAGKSRWMGVSEWALLRFATMVHAQGDWPDAQWAHFSAVMEEDLRSRHDSCVSLLTPFRDFLMAGVAKFTIQDQTTKRMIPDKHRIAACNAEFDAWWLSSLTATPHQAPATPSRTRRL